MTAQLKYSILCFQTLTKPDPFINGNPSVHPWWLTQYTIAIHVIAAIRITDLQSRDSIILQLTLMVCHRVHTTAIAMQGNVANTNQIQKQY